MDVDAVEDAGLPKEKPLEAVAAGRANGDGADVAGDVLLSVTGATVDPNARGDVGREWVGAAPFGAKKDDGDARGELALGADGLNPKKPVAGLDAAAAVGVAGEAVVVDAAGVDDDGAKLKAGLLAGGAAAAAATGDPKPPNDDADADVSEEADVLAAGVPKPEEGDLSASVAGADLASTDAVDDTGVAKLNVGGVEVADDDT